jgi:hypothetical protein
MATASNSLVAEPIITVERLDAQNAEGFFEFDPGFTRLPSGTYLIGYSFHIEHPGMYYVSLEGTPRGYIGYLSGLDEFFAEGDSFPSDSSLKTTSDGPEYMRIVGREYEIELSGSRRYALTEISIESVALQTRAQRRWKVIFRTEEENSCAGASLSPNHTWIAGNCLSKGVYYPYFLESQQWALKILDSQDLACVPGSSLNNGWGFLDWSPAGDEVLMSCVVDSELVRACLVSLETGMYHCSSHLPPRQPIWSFDGSRVAFYDSDHNELLITDSRCLIETGPCVEYIRASLPDPYYTLNAAWGDDETTIAWSVHRDFVNGVDYADISIADLGSGAIRTLTGPKGAEVHAFSPGGEWLLLFDNYQAQVEASNWMLLSIDGQVLRRIPPGLNDFWGWWVIP